MATSEEDDIFRKTEVSSDMTPESAHDFYLEHGLYYHEDAEIGDLAAALGDKAPYDGLSRLLPIVSKDARAHAIIRPFLAGSYLGFYILGADKGKFFAHTIDNDGQDNRIVIYMLPSKTCLQFFQKAHRGRLRGVPANRLVQIPYKFLKNIRNLRDFEANMDKGGL
ncbi:hypothetical protein F66182_5643 [Fusarium sp. NRRL 66182]|nr:hypothetical protein F66182_5643 [Fusarium sp. NRRL 66182]